MNTRVKETLDILFKDLVSLSNSLTELEDSVEFNDSESVEEVNKILEDIKFTLPTINGGIIVLQESVRQYVEEKTKNRRK